MDFVIDDRFSELNAALENDLIRRFFLRTRVKILLVVDGFIQISTTAGFGVGALIDIIEANEFFPCVDFNIHCARRSLGNPSINLSATSHQFRYDSFKFTMDGFNINDYDQVWFFGFNPGNDGADNDDSVNDEDQVPLDDAELKIVAEWMDLENGGVLAMGDHHYLGASMCSKIPRVRNMRRWTNDQNVPTIGGFDRHDTNQPASYVGQIPFDAQEDNVPQTIEVLQKVLANPFIFGQSFAPHPILCGIDGIIDVLPDHPHEGETLGKRYDTGTGGTPVDTTGSTEIPGYDVPEYPAGIDGNLKPEPEIIALGHPINDPRHEKNNKPASNPTNMNETTPFGLISVYDGDKAGVGRVVVDSTWHHWFTENLSGFNPASAHYKQIQNYFKNVAAWLSAKRVRRGMMYCFIWDHLVLEFDPMHYSIQDSVWYLGEQAYDVLGRMANQCLRTEWIDEFVRVEFRELFRFPPEPFPCLTCPPFELLEIAILGGIMKSLYPLVEQYRLQGVFERVELTVEEISRRALEGVRLGQSAYIEAFKASKERSDKLLAALPKAFRDVSVDEFSPKIDKRMLAIELETILFRYSRIPYLLEKGDYYLVLDLAVNSVPLNRDRPSIRLPDLEFKSKKSFRPLIVAKVNEILVSTQFEEGEELQMALFLVYGEGDPASRRKLWETDFDGPPSQWVGRRQIDMSTVLDDSGENKVDVLLSITEIDDLTKQYQRGN